MDSINKEREGPLKALFFIRVIYDNLQARTASGITQDGCNRSRE
jgi:hypothetical protein